jgi:hypothetical protein
MNAKAHHAIIDSYDKAMDKRLMVINMRHIDVRSAANCVASYVHIEKKKVMPPLEYRRELQVVIAINDSEIRVTVWQVFMKATNVYSIETQLPYDVLAFIHLFKRDDGELTR